MLEETKKAGLLLRFAAKIIDFILVAASAETIPKAGFFAGLAYLFISDSLFEGKSIGKRLLKLRVLSTATGKACAAKESILRNFTLCIGLMLWKIPIIGWIFIFLLSIFEFITLLGSKENMRFGDEIAMTIVIEDK